jgi:hypothetical protein
VVFHKLTRWKGECRVQLKDRACPASLPTTDASNQHHLPWGCKGLHPLWVQYPNIQPTKILPHQMAPQVAAQAFSMNMSWPAAKMGMWERGETLLQLWSIYVTDQQLISVPTKPRDWWTSLQPHLAFWLVGWLVPTDFNPADWMF